MGYLGNAPALAYTSFAKQDFTVTATTSYSLDHPVANENELALFINFVRQEAGTAYSASGTTLTLTEATSSSDDMYCVFLGKAVQTVNPPNASVGTSQLVDGAVTPSKQSALANPFASQLLHVRDEKASANGGDCIAGNQVRTLNTIITNEITGASLSSNRITLPAGTYYIDAQAPAFFCGRHRIFLYNYTDSSNIIIGLHTYSTANTGGDVNHSFLYGRFTITAQKEIELHHSTQVAKSSNGLGLNRTDGLTGVFANVLIWRTA
jgi:hypothetical protein